MRETLWLTLQWVGAYFVGLLLTAIACRILAPDVEEGKRNAIAIWWPVGVPLVVILVVVSYLLEMGQQLGDVLRKARP